MCKIIEKRLGNKTIVIADIKEKYIQNIIDSAKKCDYIDKIMLFGSCTNEKCTKDSDIDIAVFGNVSKNKCFSSRKYRNFVDGISSYDDYSQTYDILYFQTGREYSDSIYKDSLNGQEIYIR